MTFTWKLAISAGLAVALFVPLALRGQTVLKQPPRSFKITHTDAEWRKLLTPGQYYILRQKGTEPAFKNAYFNNHAKGVYLCAATREPLFSSADKYDSGTGWPSFTRPIKPGAVLFVEDNSDGMQRVEVIDALSGGHLGHVFKDGPPPTGLRFCMDSDALIFVPDKK